MIRRRPELSSSIFCRLRLRTSPSFNPPHFGLQNSFNYFYRLSQGINLVCVLHRSLSLALSIFATMADEPRKRSRFDQTEPKRASRFDRRSRSPPSRTTTERSRSPLARKSPVPDAKADPAAAAAAAAARINAQIQARKAELPPAQPVSDGRHVKDM
jgi:hypothetical protein